MIIVPDDFQSLLPSNRTKLEVDIEKALLLRQFVIQRTRDLSGIKNDPPDNLLPWLVWEYGLTEIVPYLPGLRTVLKEGLLWQKERGTEAGVRRALGWVDIDPSVFEHEVPGVHWNEFQMDLGKVPTKAEIEATIALSDLSSPARSKLRRLYHHCDTRRFILSESDWGDLLGDYSGIRPPEYGGYLTLAFCHHEDTQTLVPANPLHYGTNLLFGQGVSFRDVLRLSFDPHPNHDALIKLFLGSITEYKQGVWLNEVWQNHTWENSRLINAASVKWLVNAGIFGGIRKAAFSHNLLHSLQVTKKTDINVLTNLLADAAVEYKQGVWLNELWQDYTWNNARLINRPSIKWLVNNGVDAKPTLATHATNLKFGQKVEKPIVVSESANLLADAEASYLQTLWLNEPWGNYTWLDAQARKGNSIHWLDRPWEVYSWEDSRLITVPSVLWNVNEQAEFPERTSGHNSNLVVSDSVKYEQDFWLSKPWLDRVWNDVNATQYKIVHGTAVEPYKPNWREDYWPHASTWDDDISIRSNLQ